jgi:hypothetical protein
VEGTEEDARRVDPASGMYGHGGTTLVVLTRATAEDLVEAEEGEEEEEADGKA